MEVLGIIGEGKFTFSREDEKRFPGRENNWSRPLRLNKVLIGRNKTSIRGVRTVVGNKVRWKSIGWNLDMLGLVWYKEIVIYNMVQKSSGILDIVQESSKRVCCMIVSASWVEFKRYVGTGLWRSVVKYSTTELYPQDYGDLKDPEFCTALVFMP